MLYLFGSADTSGPLQANLVVVDELAAAGANIRSIVYPGATHLLPEIDFKPDVAAWLQEDR